MKLHDLQPSPGARTPSRRLGRGHGSGRGKTAGRGTKGQKSRSGASIPAWFEGGQTPLHVRTPKLHGFRNRGRVEYAAVNLGRLADAEPGILITPDVLLHDGLLRRSKTKTLPVKILGSGDAPKGVTIHAHAFSRSALDKIAAAGSVAQRISWPDGAPLDEPVERKEPASARRRKKEKKAGSESAEPAESAGEDAAGEDAAGEARDEGPDETNQETPGEAAEETGDQSEEPPA